MYFFFHVYIFSTELGDYLGVSYVVLNEYAHVAYPFYSVFNRNCSSIYYFDIFGRRVV